MASAQKKAASAASATSQQAGLHTAATAESAAAVGALEPTTTAAQTGSRAGNSFKNSSNEDDVFDEKFVKTFDQEGTPAVISGRASLSDITLSDDETVSWKNY